MAYNGPRKTSRNFSEGQIILVLVGAEICSFSVLDFSLFGHKLVQMNPLIGFIKINIYILQFKLVKTSIGALDNVA